MDVNEIIELGNKCCNDDVSFEEWEFEWDKFCEDMYKTRGN